MDTEQASTLPVKLTICFVCAACCGLTDCIAANHSGVLGFRYFMDKS